MRKFAVILAILLAATAARGELNLTTNDAWQDIIQATNSVAINLAPGTYAVAGQLYLGPTNANITLTGNYDTRDGYGVTSNGQAEVVMTGGGTSRVIYVWGGATNITIRGVTITGGHTVPSDFGAGIDAQFAGHYLLDRCNVVSNTSTAGPAGAHNGKLVNSTIGYNISSTNIGGAWLCTVSNCVVVGNSAVGAGVDVGGLSYCTVYDSIIKGNTAQDDYGAAYKTYFRGCTIVSNASGDDHVVYGGGMEDCIVEYNTAADVCAGLGGASASNTIFRFNSARQAGAMYSVNGWGLTVQSNVASTANGAASGGTFYYSLFQGNCTTSSASTGGGAGGGGFNAYSCVFDGNYVTRAGYPQAINDANDIRNCTFVNHTTNGAVVTGYKTTSMVYNCIFYNNTSNYIARTTNTSNNITADDPLFLESETNYLLSAESPAVDAGDDALTHAGTDFYGRDRTQGLAVDIGAVEYQSGDTPPAEAVTNKKKILMMMLGGH
jgi:hypothetical protein